MTTVQDKIIARSFLYISACWLLLNSASAQIHPPHLPQNRLKVLAEDRFVHRQYQTAEQAAKLFLQQDAPVTDPKPYASKDKAAYIIAASGLELAKPGSEEKALAFIEKTTDPAYKQRTAYHLAQYYFRKQEYEKAIDYYELAGISNLDNKEIINAKFELAYCYFSNSRFDMAEPLLASVREIGGRYYDAGNYYYGLLAYNRNNYKDALSSFTRIENNPAYSNIVPYYIAEIHYFTGNKEKALNDAVRLINRAEKSFYHKELHLLAAQVHFENKNFTEALPYFEYYYDNTDRIRKEDLYEMAFCYYKLQDWENAIDFFKELSDTRDSLGQSSMYLLGDCYLKTGDKKSARNAFSICADMPFQTGEKEAALFLASKLSYELGYNNDAIYYINILLADFPETQHTDEAKTMLSDLLIRTRNYAEAYDALLEVNKRNDAYDRIYQKVTYGYAIQQMQAGSSSFADSLLSMSLSKATDPTYKAAAIFWKADLAYKAGNFEKAYHYGKNFLQGNTGKQWVEYLSPAATDRNAFLLLGHASMELSRFTEAQEYFAKARGTADSYDSVFILATVLREADAVFMQKDYAKAINLYDKIIATNGPEADYARYQKAIILGLRGVNKEKTEILSGLVNSVPPSKYAGEARYELGLTYIEDDKYTAAVNVLQPLTESTEGRNFASKAWMKIGFAWQQAGNPPKAIDAYKKIVTDFPTSEERPAALDALKSLYIQAGEPEGYAQLLKQNNLGEARDNMLDSTYYATAEAAYAAGEWKKAKTLFGDYLRKYPNGVFITKAHYYKAESHAQLREQNEALQHYAAVLDNSWSNFSENSARRAAEISFEKGAFANAKKYYSALRNMAMDQDVLQAAYNGLMLSAYNLEEHKEAAQFADTLLAMPGLSADIKSNAQLLKANALLRNGNTAEALPAFRQLESAKVGTVAAEARYNIAHIHYLQNELPEAEKAANNTIQLSGGSEYWVVKSYILLADILTKQKDYFNAKATLQSIVKNCKIPELKNEAAAKLKEVKQLESKKSKLSTD